MRDNHDQQVFDEFQQEVWDLEEALEATTKKLDKAEVRIKRLEEALTDCALVLSGDTMTKQSIVSALTKARAALEDK